ncbi:MAG: lytic murein transglycosylase [Gaiellaceae bacterium]
MKTVIVAAALGLAIAAGTARAGSTWVVVPTTPATVLSLPSADVPSLSGALPLGWTSPPAAPQQLSYSDLLSLWQRAGAAYGIPWEVLAAINKVESNFGRNMGPSSAGAIGWMQFMPDTWLRWGTDANGDGVADPWNAEDGIFSAARYLAAAGGAQDIARAVYSYNHADWYVREVLQLAQLFGDAGSTETFALDRLQVSLEQAQNAVVAASDALVAAQQDAKALTHRSDALSARAAHARLLSRRLTLEQVATQAGAAAAEASARAQEAQRQLLSAQNQLARAREQSRTASFSPAAASLLDAAQYGGGYAFPVGGGPAVVSAGHSHHDYPAVDIAAPEGAPVYALENGTVLRSWSQPDPACGIGFTWLGDDGMTWTYCHLSWIDPTIQPGAHLTTGQLVGLVGHTGDATGPHLHLQADPPTIWPQQLGWFDGFAGTAFRWQDGPTSGGAAPVFSVVPDAAAVVGFTTQ